MTANTSKVAKLNFLATSFITPELQAAALVSAATAAAVGDASESLFLDLVARKIAPQPVIRRTRFTRWRATDVAAFWRTWADQPADDDAERRALIAMKASNAAALKRAGAKVVDVTK